MLRIPDSTLWIPDSMSVDSEFHICGFRIPQTKITWIPDSGLPYMGQIQPPTALNLLAKHKAANWKFYKQQWENYSIVAQLEKQTEEYKVALFLYSIGPDAIKIYNSFD